MKKRVLSVLLILVTLALNLTANILAADAQEALFPPAIAVSSLKEIGIGDTSSHSIAVDLTTQKTIIDTKSDDSFPITGKPVMMMVAYAAVRYNKGNEVKIKAQCITDTKNNPLGLKEGMVVSFNDLLAATLMFNDVNSAQSLALSVSGSYAEFVKQMNYLAFSLDMESTVFTNVTGNSDSKQVSSVRDIAALAYYCYKNSTLLDLVSARTYYVRTDEIASVTSVINNPFPMLDSSSDYYNAGVFGIGGSSGADGYSLSVVLFSLSNEKYIIVLRTKGNDYCSDAKTALEYVGANFVRVDVSDMIFELGSHIVAKVGDNDVAFSIIKSSVKNSGVIVNKFYSKSILSMSDEYTIEPPSEMPREVEIGDTVEGFAVKYKGIKLTTVNMTVKSVGEVVTQTTTRAYTLYTKSASDEGNTSGGRSHTWIIWTALAVIAGAALIVGVGRFKKI